MSKYILKFIFKNSKTILAVAIVFPFIKSCLFDEGKIKTIKQDNRHIGCITENYLDETIKAIHLNNQSYYKDMFVSKKCFLLKKFEGKKYSSSATKENQFMIMIEIYDNKRIVLYTSNDKMSKQFIENNEN